MKVARFLLGLFVATVLQILGLHFFPSFLMIVDLFLVLTLVTSLEHGPAGSMVAGSVAGLVQDALTGGLFGLHGFSYTLVAWSAARIRQRVMIHQPNQVGLLFALSAAVNQTLLVALQFFILPGTPLPGPAVLLTRMLTTSIVGTLLYVLARRFLGRFDIWREKRQRRLALEVD